MRFIIGGSHSGKSAYAEKAYGVTDIPDADFDNVFTAAAVKNFHLFIRKIQGDTKIIIDEILEKNPDIIIICDEIGCGIVPVDAADRDWRERLGRTCCYIARKAETVVRVICGIGNVIK